MRVWLKTMIKPESRRWREDSFPSAEDALLHWLSLPLNRRFGALLHEESPTKPRNPRDDEVLHGILVTTETMGLRLLRHRLTIEPQPARISSGYPRVKFIQLGGRTYDERDVLDDRAVAAAREALAREGEIPRASFRASARPRPDPRRPAGAPGAAAPRRDDADVVDAEWTEVAAGDAGGDAAVEAPGGPSDAVPASDPGPVGVDVPGYRGALAICLDLSPSSGRAYRGACDEASERLEEFLSVPAAGKARNAARAAHALLHALPRHFPSAEAAGRWAMVARPAIGAFAEAAVAWAASVSPAALTHRPPEPPEDRAAPADVARAAAVADVPEASPVPEAEPVADTVAAAPSDSTPSDGAVSAPSRPARKRRVRPPVRPAPAAPPEPAPPQVPAAPAPGDAPHGGEARRLTPTERKVVQVMDRRVPMRKHEIAAKAGIGRGSANRVVDRLVERGVCLMPVPLRYVLGAGARR